MRENDHVTEDVTLMEGERSCQSWSVQWREISHYGGGQFKEGRMVDIEVASLMEGEWFCYKGGLFNGWGMVM